MQQLVDGTSETIFAMNMAGGAAYKVEGSRFDLQISFWAVLVWIKFIFMF